MVDNPDTGLPLPQPSIDSSIGSNFGGYSGYGGYGMGMGDYGSPVVINDPLTKSQQADRWKNRRLMAWTSLISMLVVTVLMMFVVPKDRLAALDNPTTWFYVSMASIVGAYTGFATISDWKDRNFRA